MNNTVVNLAPAIIGTYSSFFSGLPVWIQDFLGLFFWALLIMLYSIFIWKFCKWISKKDILELNLSRFNKSDHAVVEKIVGGIIYFFEYLVILPFVVFLWFGVFTIFLVLMTKSLDLSTLLIISVVVVAAIRMTAYYKQPLSQDLAKLIPFNLLALAITQGLFDFPKVFGQIQEIPNFFSQIWVYLVFIVILEFILRLVDIIFITFEVYDEKDIGKN